MSRLCSELRYLWTYFKWKRRAHRRRRPVLRVGNLRAFFADLNARGVAYVVLRWFDEIPVTSAEEAAYSGDLDLMVDSRHFKEFCRAVASHPGKIKIDLYSEGVQLGTGYARLPYYPPQKALDLLASRELYKGVFQVPGPRLALLSLCYHLVYHKGVLCGLPFGLEDGVESEEASPSVSHHDIRGELSRLASACGESLPSGELTLWDLHQWLCDRHWNMPFDLLARWGKPNAWHRLLLSQETGALESLRGGLSDMLVFLLREDAFECQADGFIRERLGDKFQIVDVVDLDAEQQERVMRDTRGGDWTRHKSLLMVRPVQAVICHDCHPQPVPSGHPLGKIHVNVRNVNVFFKHELRRMLEERFPGAASNFLHGSDNDLESVAYLLAIYGKGGFVDSRQRLLDVIARGR